tara:strand:+ start:2424 stop:3728 length:1305 start_codon:yes stop_codon:yes gene_type:complete
MKVPDARERLAKILDVSGGLAYFAWGYLIQLITPQLVLAPKLRQVGRIPNIHSKHDVEDRLVFAKRALIRNLTFFLEPRFRLALYRVISRWARSPDLGFHESKIEIFRVIEQRPWFASKLIPSDGIAQTLSSYGFFSCSAALRVGGASSLNLNLMAVTQRFKLLLALDNDLRPAVRTDVSDTRRRGDKPFSAETVSFISRPSGMVPIRKSAERGRVLIVGPSRISSMPDTSEFSEVLVVITLNLDLETLRSRILRHGASVILSEGVASYIVNNGPQALDWIEVLRVSRHIYCGQSWVAQIEEFTGVQTSPHDGNLKHLWNYGYPNGLQRALSLTSSWNFIATIIGGNFYLSRKLYEQEWKEKEVKGAEAGVRKPDEFATCFGYAGHQPDPNFLMSKKLYLAGFIEGDSEVARILSLTLDEYLLELEDSIGVRRL